MASLSPPLSASGVASPSSSPRLTRPQERDASPHRDDDRYVGSAPPAGGSRASRTLRPPAPRSATVDPPVTSVGLADQGDFHYTPPPERWSVWDIAMSAAACGVTGYFCVIVLLSPVAGSYLLAAALGGLAVSALGLAVKMLVENSRSAPARGADVPPAPTAADSLHIKEQ